MPLSLGLKNAGWAACLAGATLLTGCGGSSGVGNTSTARLRAVDAAPNAGSSNIEINSSATYGDQQYFQFAGTASQPASPYYYIQPQSGVSFTYSAGVSLPTNAQAVTNNYDINQGNYYTAFLIGRSDTYNVSPTDPRFLQVIVPAPRGGANTSQATLRILNAAPDAGYTAANYAAGAVNVTIGTGAGATTFSNIAYATASGYQTLTPGSSLPVTVTLAAPGSGAVTTTTTTISVSSNTVYTLVLAEPTVAPPTYDLKLLSE